MGKCHDSAKIFAMLGWREDGASIFRRATFEAIDKPDRLVKKKKKKSNSFVRECNGCFHW